MQGVEAPIWSGDCVQSSAPFSTKVRHHTHRNTRFAQCDFGLNTTAAPDQCFEARRRCLARSASDVSIESRIGRKEPCFLNVIGAKAALLEDLEIVLVVYK